MIFYKVKAIVSNLNDIRSTWNRRRYNPLFNQTTVELYWDSGYMDIVVLAKTKRRFMKVEFAIVSKKTKFDDKDAKALVESFFKKVGLNADILDANEITFAELEYLLNSAEYKGNIWSSEEIIDMIGINEYYRIADKEYLIQEKRDNEEIYMNASKSSYASSLIPELVGIFMNSPNNGNNLSAAYVIHAQSKRDTHEVLQLLLGSLFTNGWLSCRRVCTCNYKDGLVRDRLDDVFNFCAGGTLVIDFTQMDPSFTPDPFFMKTLVEVIKAEQNRVRTILLIPPQILILNKMLTQVLSEKDFLLIKPSE